MEGFQKRMSVSLVCGTCRASRSGELVHVQWSFYMPLTIRMAWRRAGQIERRPWPATLCQPSPACNEREQSHCPTGKPRGAGHSAFLKNYALLHFVQFLQFKGAPVQLNLARDNISGAVSSNQN